MNDRMHWCSHPAVDWVVNEKGIRSDRHSCFCTIDGDHTVDEYNERVRANAQEK